MAMAQLPLNAPRYIFHWTAAVHVQHIDELSTVAPLSCSADNQLLELHVTLTQPAAGAMSSHVTFHR